MHIERFKEPRDWREIPNDGHRTYAHDAAAAAHDDKGNNALNALILKVPGEKETLGLGW